MATNRTTHMNITVPDLVEPGPAYATDVSNSLDFIGEHDHDGINTGPLINIAGQQVLNDLNMNGFNITNVNVIRLNNQITPPSGISDVNEFTAVNGNAYFINGNGTPVQLSNGNQAVTLPFNNFTSTNVINTNLIIPSNAGYNLINVSTSSTASTITLPLAASVVNGTFYIIQDIGNNVITDTITVKVPGGSGNYIYYNGAAATSYVFSANGQSVIFVSDGVSSWHTLNYDKNTFYGETLSYKSTTLNLDGYSALTGYGTYTWNSPADAWQVTAAAVEITAPDIFLIGSGGFSGSFQAGGPVTGAGVPFQFGVHNVTVSTSMTVSATDCENPVIYLQTGTLTANSSLTLNTTAPGIWFIIIGQVTFNSHSLTIQNAGGGGFNCITTPASGTPVSTMVITAISPTSGTLWTSTTGIL